MYEICQVCGWEDDGYDEPKQNIAEPNGMTIVEARRDFEAFGGTDMRTRHLRRDPLPEQMPRSDVRES